MALDTNCGLSGCHILYLLPEINQLGMEFVVTTMISINRMKQAFLNFYPTPCRDFMEKSTQIRKWQKH